MVVGSRIIDAFALVLVAMLFFWLIDPKSRLAAAGRLFPVPKLVLVAIGVFAVFFVSMLFDSEISSVFYLAAKD